MKLTPVSKAVWQSGYVGENYKQMVRDREARRRAKEANRPRKPYYNPSEEQRAAAASRRKAQADFKAGKQFRRVGQTKPTSWAKLIAGSPGMRKAGAAAVVAGGSGYALHRERQNQQKTLAFAKAYRPTSQQKQTALGGVTGGAASYAAVGGTANAGKKYLARQRQRTGISPHEEKIWSEHKRRHGINGAIPKDKTLSAKKKGQIFGTYPKELPGWKMQRAIALKNKPGVTSGAVVAGAAAGAAIAHERAKKKSAFGV